ncbi:MAG: GNAT family N-acetyltransferase [Blautia sp.]|nr:GNAT family N-acetyltransferase [Blautia sp.]
MKYTLKNADTVNIRQPRPDDAAEIIEVFKLADTETRFLGRNPGEFNFSIESERKLIEDILTDNNRVWYLPEYRGKIVGQCAANIVRNNERFLHRASLGFVLLKEYWNLGIGSAMMEECLAWCREHKIELVHIEVVTQNGKAIGLYKKYGFEIIGTTPHALKYPDGTYADEYLMVKQMY